jgi:hypothetical protein
VNPLWTIKAAKVAGLRLPLACAVLEQESGGGRNIFGHDPTGSIPAAWKGGQVTKLRYLAYKARRGRYGMQGVGPCQLTWWATQDLADKAGGCHLPYPNMAIGFMMLEDSIRAHGLWKGVALYNGSGAAAQNYARHVLGTLLPKWQLIIGH